MARINDIAEGKSNEMGIPHGQTPGFGKGNKEVSMNQLVPNSRVIKTASSNLMEGNSTNRPKGSI